MKPPPAPVAGMLRAAAILILAGVALAADRAAAEFGCNGLIWTYRELARRGHDNAAIGEAMRRVGCRMPDAQPPALEGCDEGRPALSLAEGTPLRAPDGGDLPAAGFLEVFESLGHADTPTLRLRRADGSIALADATALALADPARGCVLTGLRAHRIGLDPPDAGPLLQLAGFVSPSETQDRLIVRAAPDPAARPLHRLARGRLVHLLARHADRTGAQWYFVTASAEPAFSAREAALLGWIPAARLQLWPGRLAAVPQRAGIAILYADAGLKRRLGYVGLPGSALPLRPGAVMPVLARAANSLQVSLLISPRIQSGLPGAHPAAWLPAAGLRLHAVLTVFEHRALLSALSTLCAGLGEVAGMRTRLFEALDTLARALAGAPLPATGRAVALPRLIGLLTRLPATSFAAFGPRGIDDYADWAADPAHRAEHRAVQVALCRSARLLQMVETGEHGRPEDVVAIRFDPRRRLPVLDDSALTPGATEDGSDWMWQPDAGSIYYLVPLDFLPGAPVAEGG
ncbi:MAG: hypothetical protein D6754_10125 [Alphaproteobacteria bacterium]|nr:MAG: hypothetical protein D6754_10125 [Alphaproteobacteria bacterium]